MKIGANEPCPCGSGLKYKKCCRTKELQDLSGREMTDNSSGLLSSDEALPPWESIAHRLKGRYLSLGETRKLFRHSHKLYLTQVQELLEGDSPEQWERGLRLVEQIPWDEAKCLHGVINMHATLLHRLGRVEETLTLQRKHLLDVDNELLWAEKGLVFQQDVIPLTPMQQEERVSLLLDVGQRTSFAIPFLLALRYISPEAHAGEGIDKIAAYCRRALATERWRKLDVEQSPWLALILGVLVEVLQVLILEERNKAATTLCKLSIHFSWEEWQGQSISEPLDNLGVFFSKLEQWDLLDALAARFLVLQGSQGVAHTWLGLSALAQNKLEAAVQEYKRALTFGSQLRQEAIVSFLGLFSAQRAWEEMGQALELLENPERPEVLGSLVPYHLAHSEHEQALSCLKRLCELNPEQPSMWVRRWLVLETLGYEEELAQELLDVLEVEDSSPKGRAALALMGLHDTRHFRFEAALDRLSSLEALDVTRPVWDNLELWARVLEAKGQCWRALGDEATAFPWFLQALQAYPSEWRYHQALLSLLQSKEWEQAQTLWEEAQQSYPDSLHIRYARFLLAEHEEDWEECWNCLERIGLERFRELGLLKEGLFLFLRTFVYQERWWEAFSFCEEHLTEILADDDLRELREKLVVELGSRFQSMQSLLGEQQQQLSTLERKQHALFRTLEHARNRRDSLREALQQQESMSEQLGEAYARQKQATVEAQRESKKAQAQKEREAVNKWVKERSDLFEGLSSTASDLLQSAEILWRNLESHSNHDHGPVILQLARVVESVVNQALIDPLVSLTLQQGGSLQDFPRVAVGSLKPSKNRLSLGDVASLLFHRMEWTEPDGSQRVELNPLSSDEHKQRLDAFWASDALKGVSDEQRLFLQHELPLRLRELGKIRNKASHAGSPLSREQVEQVREKVLGRETGEGWLRWLVSL